MILNQRLNQNGFTIVELLIVIGTLAILAAISVGSFSVIQKRSLVDSAAQDFAGVLRFAKSKTIASENSSQYGAYINASVRPHRYVLFKGSSYADRDSVFDQTYLLPAAVEFFGISLGQSSEIVFQKQTGSSSASGNVSIRHVADASESRTIYIALSGVIGFDQSSAVSDESRIKDSRHVHFDYSRAINTASESMILSFNSGSVVQTIPIASAMAAGQINWQGTVSVGGSSQVVSIRTHRLNSPGSQFSISRDRRYNNASFAVSLSGDNSGSIANYSSDGLTTGSVSIYVSNFSWQ